MTRATKVRFLLQTIVFVSVSFASCQSWAFAQEPDQQIAPAPPGRSPGMTGNAIDILTPTAGVDFGQYISKLVDAVRKNWYASMPQEVYDGARGRTVVLLRIQADGKIVNISIESGSGSNLLDQAAMNGVRSANPFDPLPPKFKGPYVDLRFAFWYNLAGAGAFRKSLLDCEGSEVGSPLPAFDRLELLSFLGDPGSLPYAAKQICGRGIDFVPDSGFFTTLTNSGVSPAFVESLKRSKPKSIGEPSPERVSAYGLVDLALTDEHRGQLATASEDYARALKLAPDSATLHLAYARNLLAEHRYSEAETQARQSLALWQEDAEAHYALAFALSAQHRDSEAIPEARGALRIFPSHNLALIELGITLARSGNYQEAVPVLRESLPHAPQLPVIYKHLGGSLVHTGEFDEAILDLNLYLKTNPQDAEAHYFLGVALRSKGRQDEALVELREAERIDPSNPIYSAAVDPTDSGAPLEGSDPASPRPDNGFFSGDIYTNRFFGFSYEYPKDWAVQKASRGQAIVRLGGSIIANGDPVAQDAAEAGARNAYQLLLVTKEATTDISTTFNTIQVSALSTRFQPEVKSGGDFLSGIIERWRHSAGEISVVVPPTESVIDGRTFWKVKLDFTIKETVSHSIEFATVEKDYVVLFVFSSRDNAKVEESAKTMKSLRFLEAAH
jgi:TonB family protein